jgi:hypothetical protein
VADKEREYYRPSQAVPGEIIYTTRFMAGGSVAEVFNGQFLVDALGKNPEEIWLYMSGELDPVKITHRDGRVAVIMPVRATVTRSRGF